MTVQRQSDPGSAPPRIGTLASLVGDGGRAYDLVLSDVWGVVHDGVRVRPGAGQALTAAREAGARVVLITNSPRPRDGVVEQLDALGVPRSAWDEVVTSGDVTRHLIRAADAPVYHLGPERDRPLFEGTGATLVDEGEAGVVVCTGLFDDETESPADYAALLSRLHERGLPMIVANPDIVVERGSRMIWCAGSLARDYAKLGGETRTAGKPHRPIYETAIAAGEALIGSGAERSRILAIGDGMPTDVRGALDFGIDLLFIAGGIHAGEYGGADASPTMLADFLAANEASEGVVGWMPRLA